MSRPALRGCLDRDPIDLNRAWADPRGDQNIHEVTPVLFAVQQQPIAITFDCEGVLVLALLRLANRAWRNPVVVEPIATKVSSEVFGVHEVNHNNSSDAMRGNCFTQRIVPAMMQAT
ncbi:hypothetical protein [Roseovarius arcticus]|uniref:hypothetical protein n=1 Tax=Roseovarius arcticus TaxID=2547404 RepID=UPI001FEB1CD4|nr:hypothetical protein [Roseovarius arcticus]